MFERIMNLYRTKINNNNLYWQIQKIWYN
jgi:hypothetical protein